MLRPIILSLLLVLNIYHRKAIQSNSLRDEDVQFPPQKDHSFSQESDPVLKGVKVAELVSQLKDVERDKEFGGYARVVWGVLVMVVWAMEPTMFAQLQ